MKKNKVFGLIVLGMILAGLLVCLNRDILLDRFWSKIESQLDYERSLKVGDDFNKISWGNLSFQINHHKSVNKLEYVSVADKESYILLKNIASYKIVEEKLYVKSKDGYAVIDKNNLCRVCVTVPDDEFVNGYTVDDAGNEIPISRYIENENVIYLKSYSEFTDEERKVFEKMEK